MRDRLSAYWARHRTLFWSLHSVWALATGIAVVLLARERYAFIPWVVVFLGLTWISTLVFGRRVEAEPDAGVPVGLGQEVTSYATRTLYQETLFFLLPFYAYSTVLRSTNVLFTGLLIGLAVFSCIDLVFDRWLRTRPAFGFIFFATVAFAAVNLLLPMLIGLRPSLATPAAAVIAVVTALPLAMKGVGRGPRSLTGPIAAGVAILLVALVFPRVIPPVPLRMQSATFAQTIDRTTLELDHPVESGVRGAALNGYLVVLMEVFAPANVPTQATLKWTRDGQDLKTSRTVEILAHEGAFRIWDAYNPDSGVVEPGRYSVTLNSTDRVFGVAQITVE